MANGIRRMDPWTLSISHLPSAMTESLLTHELPQHVGKDPAVPECDEFFRRVDPRDCLELRRLVATSERTHRNRSARPQALCDAGDLVPFAPRESERRRRRTRLELQRQDTHVDEVAAVNPLEALSDHRAHAEQQRAFGRPVAR